MRRFIPGGPFRFAASLLLLPFLCQQPLLSQDGPGRKSPVRLQVQTTAGLASLLGLLV